MEKPEEETGTPSGAINVSDEKGESTGSPPPQTQEKEKKKKEKEPKKKKWPKPIQDWWDKKKAADEADLRTNFRRNGYEFARGIFVVNTLKSKRGEELSRLEYEARMKAHSPGATQEDKDNAKKAEKEFQKFGEEHDKDFIETPEGRKEYEKVTDAEKAAAKAHDAEKEAGKNIDSATKEAVQKAEAQGNEQPGVEEDRQEIH